MPYNIKKDTNQDTRIQALKLQLYGKDSQVFRYSATSKASSAKISLDRAYTDYPQVKHDLIKIISLAGIIFVLQFLLYLKVG